MGAKLRLDELVDPFPNSFKTNHKDYDLAAKQRDERLEEVRKRQQEVYRRNLLMDPCDAEVSMKLEKMFHEPLRKRKMI